MRLVVSECECDPNGIEPDQSCNQKTGDCPCKNNFSGKQCDQCKDGYWNYPDCLCKHDNEFSKQSYTTSTVFQIVAATKVVLPKKSATKAQASVSVRKDMEAKDVTNVNPDISDFPIVNRAIVAKSALMEPLAVPLENVPV